MQIKDQISRLKSKIIYGLRSYLSAQDFSSDDVKTEAGLGKISGSLKGKTLFITGGSRGIGLQIALRAAADGANIVIAAKTSDPHPKLPGTIFSAAKEIEAAGGKALPLKVDVRDHEQVKAAMEKAAEHFGGIDILVNNASAIYMEKTPHLKLKEFDLMQQVNTRGTFLSSQLCYPYLRKSSNPHILTLSPPINLAPPWLGEHLGYTLSKYGMSLCVMGLAQEWKADGIAVNALWPRTTIATAAIKNMPMGEILCDRSRTPQIMADAAYQILIRNSKTCTGHFFIDDEVLKGSGEENFEKYSVKPGAKLQPDLFL